MRYRFFHSILAIMVFFSSTGFVLNRHYCQGVLKSSALIVQPKSCHAISDSLEPAGCAHHQKKKTCGHDEQATDDCCQNQSEYLNQDCEKSVSPLALEVSDIVSISGKLILVQPADPLTSSTYLTYKPPIVPRNILLLVQSFLL